MKTTTSIICLYMIFGLYTGCSSDDGSIEKSTEELLTSGTWFLEERDGDGTDYTECRRQSWIQFMKDRTYDWEDYKDVSDSCELFQSGTYTWHLSTDAVLMFISPSDTSQGTIDKITEDECTILEDRNGTIYTHHWDRNPGTG